MSLVSKIRDFFSHGEKDYDNKPLDFGEHGEILYKDDIISKIKGELEKRKREKAGYEWQWLLNANFLTGNQFCEIRPDLSDVSQVDNFLPWHSREVFNRIAPLIETRSANLGKVSYSMKVKPATNELDDYAKAEVSTSVLRHLQIESDFGEKMKTAICWNELCGSCFWLSWWDMNGGNIIAKEVIRIADDDGNITESEKEYREGDVSYGLLTPYEIFPESVFKQGIESQGSIILEQVKSVDEIFDLYGIKVEGVNIHTFELTPIPSGGGLGYENTTMKIGHREACDSQKVITYMEKPTAKRPSGLMAILIGEEHLFYYGALPYDDYPIVQMVCREVPGQFFGESVIKSLIPIQRTLNAVENDVIDILNRAALGNVIAEEGSIDTDDYEENGLEPGRVLYYRQGYSKPEFGSISTLPSGIVAERDYLINAMEYVAGVSQLMVTGSTPSGITSGTAISNLMEIDNTRLSLTGENQRNCVKKLGKKWLRIYKKFGVGRRIIDCVGVNDIGSAFIWSGEDINSFDIEFTVENELIESEDMRRQRYLEAYNMGLFTDENGKIPERHKKKAIECLRVSSFDELMSIGVLHIQKAQRENNFFSEGIIPKVSEFDDHDIHIDEHTRFILQMDFEVLKMKKPDYAAAFEEHLKQHISIQEQKKQQGLMSRVGTQL